jgi:periodic tryptophan protein 2
VARIGLSPRGNLLVTVDEDGHAILTNVERRVSIYHFSFRSPVTALAFSPSGRHFAVGIGRRIEVWHVPSTPDASATGELEFAPFVRHHSHAGHYDDVTHLEWSSDSRFFLSAAKDLTARIWSLNPEAGFRPTVLAGHKQAVVGAWFSENQETIYTTSRDGAVFEWRYAAPPREGGQDDGDSDDSDSDADMGEDAIRWRIVRRHYFMQGSSTVRCAVFHPESSLLVAGFSDGVFGLYELTDAMSQIHKLSVSNDIDTVSINRSGEWVAFASAKTRSLLVWEWQSESCEESCGREACMRMHGC